MQLSDSESSTEESRSLPRAAATIASAVGSLLLHGGVLAAALYWIDTRPGAVAVPTDAISLELIQSDVTEAVEVSASLLTAASPASVQSEVGAELEAPAIEKTVEDLTPREPEEFVAAEDAPLIEMAEAAPEGIEVLEGALQVEEQTGQEAPHQAEHVETKEPPRKRSRKPEAAEKSTPAPQKKSQSAPSTKGGAKSKAAKGSAASSGRVSASTGSAINYAAVVRARVAARRPGGAGRRGTVVVSFGVSRSGGLTYASIGRSSGDASLDRSVLAAVRSAAPFPPPPPSANLRFSVPFHFR